MIVSNSKEESWKLYNRYGRYPQSYITFPQIQSRLVLAPRTTASSKAIIRFEYQDCAIGKRNDKCILTEVKLMS